MYPKFYWLRRTGNCLNQVSDYLLCGRGHNLSWAEDSRPTLVHVGIFLRVCVSVMSRQVGPFNRQLAYHGMIQTAKLSSRETVLIHAGHTPIGQAAIAFALHIGSTVFTTVRDIVHKEFLMKRFPSARRGTAGLIRPIGDDEISEQKSTLLDAAHLTRPGPPSWVDRLDVDVACHC
uniref:Uncharacterized protein n=1 Tax=Timema bartmani TaxID=61472 RepID=A0A7R9F4L4_9NEOP|nr:unnamed protein product [Timema bartmani]